MAILCNHQRSVPKTHGAQMDKMTAKLDGELTPSSPPKITAWQRLSLGRPVCQTVVSPCLRGGWRCKPSPPHTRPTLCLSGVPSHPLAHPARHPAPPRPSAMKEGIAELEDDLKRVHKGKPTKEGRKASVEQ